MEQYKQTKNLQIKNQNVFFFFFLDKNKTKMCWTVVLNEHVVI
jgi:hypothetical protein